MSELTTIARPYAKAAFDFAVEQLAQDKTAVKKWNEMLAFVAEVVKNPQIQHFLTGSFSAEKVAETVISICENQLDVYGQNLIRLMAENKRLSVLPIVFQLFQNYVEERQAIAEVRVISAKPLNEIQQQKIVEAMERKLNRKIKLNCSVDNSLLAGVIIRTDDFVIDGSSRGQLHRLADELQ